MESALRDIEQVLKRLRAGRLRIRIARPAGLFRKVPRAFFHPTPEIFIQTGGATDFVCPGDTFRLRTWETCVMPAGVPHREIPIDRRTPYGILVLMHARDGMLLHRAAASPRREIVAVSAEHVASARARAAFRYLEEITVAVPVRHRREYVASLVEAFFITALAEMNRPAAKETRSPLVAETEKLARALLASPELSVAGLAATLGCSSDGLSRRFQRETGQTLTGWIARERVSMARDLLTDPRHSVAEIGWMCGFSAPSYFIRVFREHTGVTPKQWRG